MKRFLFGLLLTILLSGSVFAATGTPSNPGYVEGDVIVSTEVHESALYVLAEELARKYELEVTGVMPILGIICLRSETKSTAELIKELSSDPYVKKASSNYYTYAPIVPEKDDGGCNTVNSGILLLIGLVLCKYKAMWK